MRPCELAGKSEAAAEKFREDVRAHGPAHASERSLPPVHGKKVDDETRAMAKEVKELETAGDTTSAPRSGASARNWITPLDRTTSTI